jgi:hypothetical protein
MNLQSVILTGQIWQVLNRNQIREEIAEGCAGTTLVYGMGVTRHQNRMDIKAHNGRVIPGFTTVTAFLVSG